MTENMKQHRVLLALVALLVAGCREDAQGPVGPGAPSLAISQGTEVFAPPGSIDAVFLEVNQEVPGFAGMIREEGEAVLLMVDGSRTEAARAALNARSPGRGFETASVPWRGVEYEWRELARWHASVIPMLVLDGVVSIDANERLNRIELGVLEGTDSATIAVEAARRGVPPGALVMRISERAVATVDLTDQVRPTVGGLRINDPDFGCTLGFNVNYSGTRTFMTASHCTDALAEDTNFPFFQDDWAVSGDSIGIEYIDPPLVDVGAFCPTGHDDCRWSDAALASYAASVTWDLGRIAKTSSSGRWSGSTTIAGSFSITGKYNPPSVGDTLHKVGSTTGWGNPVSGCVRTS